MPYVSVSSSSSPGTEPTSTLAAPPPMPHAPYTFAIAATTSELPTAFNTLEQAIGDSRYSKTETNHIFFRLLAPVTITVAKLEQAIQALLPQYKSMITQMAAYELELALPIWAPNGSDKPPKNIRVICRLALHRT